VEEYCQPQTVAGKPGKALMPDAAVVYLMNAIFSSKSKFYESTTRAETKYLFTATDEVW